MNCFLDKGAVRETRSTEASWLPLGSSYRIEKVLPNALHLSRLSLIPSAVRQGTAMVEGILTRPPGPRSVVCFQVPKSKISRSVSSRERTSICKECWLCKHNKGSAEVCRFDLNDRMPVIQPAKLKLWMTNMPGICWAAMST